MKSQAGYDVEEHIKRTEEAGCLHPPVYQLPDQVPFTAWCKLCRAVAAEAGDL